MTLPKVSSRIYDARPRRLLPRPRPGSTTEEPNSHEGQSPQGSTLPGVASVLNDQGDQGDQAQDTTQGQKRTNDEPDNNPKKRGFKRLTTKEEVIVFNICNKYASTFGKRSDICNWWRIVGEEFTNTYERPYSWHSIRRKVENSTNRRIKFLEDQEAQGLGNATEDPMNPAWVAAVDAWIPTWKRWSEAEEERIARRDAAIRRRTTRGPWRSTGLQGEMFRRELSHSPETELIAQNRLILDGMMAADAEAAGSPADTATDGGTAVPLGSPSPPTPMPAVRLPPGFESMFSNNPSTSQPSPPAQASTPYTFVPIPSTEVFAEAESDSARIPTPNADTQPQTETVIISDEPDFESDGPGFEEPQDLPVESADAVRMDDLRREMRAEWRLELQRSRAALEEKLDSVQKTQEMILEMLRQGHT